MPMRKSCNTAVIKTGIPGILQKDMQTGSERKAITDEFLHNTYPPKKAKLLNSDALNTEVSISDKFPLKKRNYLMVMHETRKDQQGDTFQ